MVAVGVVGGPGEGGKKQSGGGCARLLIPFYHHFFLEGEGGGLYFILRMMDGSMLKIKRKKQSGCYVTLHEGSKVEQTTTDVVGLHFLINLRPISSPPSSPSTPIPPFLVSNCRNELIKWQQRTGS